MQFSRSIQLQQAHKYITFVYQYLRSTGLHVWLDAGSLLKAYRGQDFIDSSDIDFGAKSSSYRAVLETLKLLEKDGYRIEIQGDFPLSGDLIKVYFPDSTIRRPSNIDIYFYSSSHSEFFRKSFHKPSPKSSYSTLLFYIINKCNPDFRRKKKLSVIPLSALINRFRRFFLNSSLLPLYKKTATTVWVVVPRFVFESFDELKIDGQSYMIPKFAQDYLEYRYGPNWVAPDPDWCPEDGAYIRHRKISHRAT